MFELFIKPVFAAKQSSAPAKTERSSAAQQEIKELSPNEYSVISGGPQVENDPKA